MSSPSRQAEMLLAPHQSAWWLGLSPIFMATLILMRNLQFQFHSISILLLTLERLAYETENELNVAEFHSLST